ncbi:MAG: endonuclease/exonuclease/phosphatase family protein [Prevotella sp.]|nr:endonuclease/exonuclease/phosphatase family protein [Prevotella sp.]
MSLSLLLVSLFTFVELNCENLFDYQHDEGFNDYEYLPTAAKKWERNRYWNKLNNIARELVACGEENEGWTLPDMIALTEVENDTVMRDLTRRSLLRGAGYEYVMTRSADERGIDVALLYSPFSFRMLSHYALSVTPPEGKHATRDILYAKGLLVTGDTLHVMVVHAPSRVDGERATRPFRLRVADRVEQAIDSLMAYDHEARVVVAGDFNDYVGDSALSRLCARLLVNATLEAKGTNGAKGTYKFRGKWGSLDHVLVSPAMHASFHDCRICDEPFLLEDDERYGGKQPLRNFNGPRWKRGFSDHLPLIVRFDLQK